MVSHFGRLSIDAPLCNFRSKEWGSKLRAELERRIGANATLTGVQWTNLSLLLASALVDGEDDWHKDKVTTCDDVKDDLQEEGDRFIGGN
jgi:hypothetical protein